MLFYQFDLLDHFIKGDLIHNLKIEKEKITETMNLYHSKKMNLLSLTTNMITMSNSLDKNKLEIFYDTVSLLKQSFENINAIQELASKLEENLDSTISLVDKSIDNNYDEIKANLVEYNKQQDELSHKVLSFETANTSIINSTIMFSLIISNKKAKKKIIPIVKKENTKIDVELEPHDNNILIISEKDQKAYLPFFYSEVKKIYKTSGNQYLTIQNVVDDLYVLPLTQFKNSSMSRFRETFHLVHKKEKGSVSKALDLALELMFKHNLNPIVIAACRNLNELNIYLDCLENNELHDFSCFEIKFEVMPQIVKTPKNTF